MKQFKQVRLEGRDKTFFEKAIKFYYFSRQQGIRGLPDELEKRFRHNGHVAYSLITKYLEERRFYLEYMDYLNREIRELIQADAENWNNLQIPPRYIDEIQLQDPTSLSWTDADKGLLYEIRYHPHSGELSYFVGRENGNP